MRPRVMREIGAATGLFAALTEVLDRHRRKGQQRIAVEHIQVPGGQSEPSPDFSNRLGI